MSWTWEHDDDEGFDGHATMTNERPSGNTRGKPYNARPAI